MVAVAGGTFAAMLPSKLRVAARHRLALSPLSTLSTLSNSVRFPWSRSPRRQRWWTLIVGVVLLSVIAAGCGQSGMGSSASVQVPVLWVAQAAGDVTGGVSQVKVSVRRTVEGGSVSTITPEDADTGDSWDAAAAMANAVGVLYSATDPRGIQTTVEVPTAIDGASAGGVLTVAVIAALRGWAINSRVAMTGSVSPDGSIGVVDGVAAKVAAAAAADYTQILVPIGATTQGNGSIDVAALSTELGIQVIAIATVANALFSFTGRSIAATAPRMSALSIDAKALSLSQTRSLQDKLEASLAAAPTVAAGTQQLVTSQLARSERAIADRDFSLAYASVLGAWLVLQQQQAVAQLEPLLAADPSAASTMVQAQLRQLNADATTAMAADQLPAEADAVTTFAVVSAKSVLATAAAVSLAVAGELAQLAGLSQSAILDAAAIAAQYRVYVDVLFPDSLQQALAPARLAPLATTADWRDFLVGYTQLMSDAAGANLTYYETVLTNIAANPDLNFSQPGHTYAAVQQLVTTSAGGNIDDASATALSAFLMSAWLVASNQSFSLTGSGIGDLNLQTNTPAELRTATATAANTVAAFTSQLAEEGINTDHIRWTEGWSLGLPLAFAGTPVELGMLTLGLSGQWNSAVCAFLNTAATPTAAVAAR